MMPRLLPILLIMQTFLIQLVSGINYVTIPVLMNLQGHNNLWIGVAMACEIIGVLLFHQRLSRIIQRMGLMWSTLLLVLLRAILCASMAWQQFYPGWLVSILGYGLCTGMQLILLQTWLNQLPLRRRGVIMGLFSASLSLGVALGPVLLQLTQVSMSQRFWLTALLSLSALLLVWIAHINPLSGTVSAVRFRFVCRHARAILVSALVGGVSFYGLPNFLTLYGISDGLTEERASLLMTMFMLGSVTLGMLVSLLSDWVNRQWIVVFCIFCSVVCAVFLALAVYADYGTTLVLLYVWGGSMGGVYSIGLSLIGDRFHPQQQMSANMSYTMMDSLGGIAGLIGIGFMMDRMGPEGMTMVLVVVGCAFLCYLVWELVEHQTPFQ
ncbi:major facilitator superfamily protein [Dickeya dadantii 3937]|uniref:Major facilitator superfamily protein n=1 Tax=Dickeya dadantii (strain 3937) TaxID=198628 RepID=E0SJQ2_DICD3|nr:MFS transporter [Dickeya dadantii]ADN00341.1 major facilitator superfamily protein [Dickeya dadantii 3937]